MKDKLKFRIIEVIQEAPEYPLSGSYGCKKIFPKI